MAKITNDVSDMPGNLIEIAKDVLLVPENTSEKVMIEKDVATAKKIEELIERDLASPKFSNNIVKYFENYSSYSDTFIDFATRYSDKLKDQNEYCKMLEYFISKGPPGIEVAKKIIEHSLKTSAKELAFNVNHEHEHQEKQAAEARLDRNLMMAAKLGNQELYDAAIAKGAQFIRDDKLVHDSKGKNLLHYACQSLTDNAELVHRIAQEMREYARDNKKFIAPDGSTVNGQFDPFKIRDDKTLGKTFPYLNEICPIHFMRPSLAAELDKRYGLCDEIAKGTFKAAVAFNILDNKIVNQRWVQGKLGVYHEYVETAALGGKFLAGTPVSMVEGLPLVQNLIASGVFIGTAAALVGGGLAMRHSYLRSKALKHAGASEDVRLPSLDKTVKPKNNYNNKLNCNHDIEEALKLRDFNKLIKIVTHPYTFKSTTSEVIALVKQIQNFDFEHPGFGKVNFFALLANKCDGANQFNELMDVLYRREENDVAKEVLDYMKSQNKFPKITDKWETKFEDQKNPMSPKRYKDVQASQKNELINAFEKFDYYKIQHIIANGNFSHTSKEIIHALQEMTVFPQVTLPPAKNDFMHVVYEGLAKKASPKEMLNLFEDLIENIGAEKASPILKNLVKEYNRNKSETKQADRERLNVCALMAARTGDKENLSAALDALKAHHDDINLLNIVDAHGNNILHYAAMSQSSSMVKHILAETMILRDFINIEQAAKTQKVFGGLVTISSAKHVMEMPNKNGDTPAKMLRDKGAAADLDTHLWTAGFRLTSTELLYQEDKARQDNLNLAANLTVAGVVMAFCSGMGIPLAIAGGAAMGATIAAHTVNLFSNVSLGAGLSEGASACLAAKATENGLMPAVRSVFQSFGKVWNKVKNNSYMRVNPDYDDRINTKYDELMTSIANEISTVKPDPQKLTEIFKNASHNLVTGESDKAMQLIAQQACQRALYNIASTIKKDPQPASYIKAIFAEASRSDKNNDVRSASTALYKINEKFGNNIKKASELKKIKLLDYSIDQLDRLKALCVSAAEMEKARGENYNNPKNIFIRAARIRASADTVRQIGGNKPFSEITKINENYKEKLVYIKKLAETYVSMLNQRQEIYERCPPALIKKYFLERLSELDGGGALTAAAEKVFKRKNQPDLDAALKQALRYAYDHDVKYPQPAKAMELMRAIQSFTEGTAIAQWALEKKKQQKQAQPVVTQTQSVSTTLPPYEPPRIPEKTTQPKITQTQKILSTLFKNQPAVKILPSIPAVQPMNPGSSATLHQRQQQTTFAAPSSASTITTSPDPFTTRNGMLKHQTKIQEKLETAGYLVNISDTTLQKFKVEVTNPETKIVSNFSVKPHKITTHETNVDVFKAMLIAFNEAHKGNNTKLPIINTQDEAKKSWIHACRAVYKGDPRLDKIIFENIKVPSHREKDDLTNSPRIR